VLTLFKGGPSFLYLCFLLAEKTFPILSVSPTVGEGGSHYLLKVASLYGLRTFLIFSVCLRETGKKGVKALLFFCPTPSSLSLHVPPFYQDRCPFVFSESSHHGSYFSRRPLHTLADRGVIVFPPTQKRQIAFRPFLFLSIFLRPLLRSGSQYFGTVLARGC